MDAKTTAVSSKARDALDRTVRDSLPGDFLEAIDFHGHLCPGLAIGYRAAGIAMGRLGVERGTDEEILGIVETDACGFDAFQVITGCTLGKGSLVYRDYGKQAFTVVRRSDGHGVRVAMRHDAFPVDEGFVKKMKRGFSAEATPEEKRIAWTQHHQRAVELLSLDESRFATITEVEVELPQPAKIFPSVVCAVCGEPVMESRLRVRDGEPCCIPCSHRYSRGWHIDS